MGFQSAFNQAVGSIGIAAAISPGLKELGAKKWEISSLKKQIPETETRYDQALNTAATQQSETNPNASDEENERAITEATKDIATELYQQQKRLFGLEPTEKNLKKLKQAEADYNSAQSLEVETYAKRRIQADFEERKEILDQKRKAKELGVVLDTRYSPKLGKKGEVIE